MSRTQQEWNALGLPFPSPFDVLTAYPRPTTPAPERKPKAKRKRMDSRAMLLSSLETPEERKARRARQEKQ